MVAMSVEKQKPHKQNPTEEAVYIDYQLETSRRAEEELRAQIKNTNDTLRVLYESGKSQTEEYIRLANETEELDVRYEKVLKHIDLLTATRKKIGSNTLKH